MQKVNISTLLTFNDLKPNAVYVSNFKGSYSFVLIQMGKRGLKIHVFEDCVYHVLLYPFHLVF